jgi:hypothetical protein
MGDDFLVKGLGILDLLAAATVLMLHYDVAWVGWRAAVFFAAYLFIKGYFFKSSIISLVDVFAGVYIILLAIGAKTILSFVIAFYLFQKSVFSLA